MVSSFKLVKIVIIFFILLIFFKNNIVEKMINDVKPQVNYNGSLSLYSLTTSQINALTNNIEGHIIFNTTTNKINIYINGVWVEANVTLGLNNGIAIGNNAGITNQGANAIAIGNNAAPTNQHSNSIVINASGNVLNTLATDSFYVDPIREAKTTNLLYYDPTTKEITYSA